ncbi:hypothetical protein QFC22_004232 [Naganishia vaughanmartiniae]|uniref:Uncharacterized protein n=1 Tax=Naganishia vaughanmartiniae TaxID=1424756 RepID=A0ACC2X4H7_9TREE|nr:hypothetical protein QFC22_004232 [Naganishia vaughanmartiniae]
MQTELVSKPQTWKDKPGMAKKRKTTTKRQYWEFIPVDDDDDDTFDEGVLGLRNGMGGIQGRGSEVNGSKRVPIKYVDSSDADSESASAVETDEGDYEEPSKSVGIKVKGKGKRKATGSQEVVTRPLLKSQKGKDKQRKKKRKKKRKTGGDNEEPQIGEIIGLSLSSMDNKVWTIGEYIISR